MTGDLEIDCPFRVDVRREAESETATCRLVESVIGSQYRDLCTVGRDACLACRATTPHPFSGNSEIVSSLLYSACDQALANIALGVPKADNGARLIGIRDRAERLLQSGTIPPTTYSCDVVVCCTQGDAATKRAIDSVLAQRGVTCVVHLVDDGGDATELVNSYAERANVLCHFNPHARGPFGCLQELAQHLRTPFIAFQADYATSHPFRLARCLERLDACGAEILGCDVRVGEKIVRAKPPTDCFERCLPVESLVMRRATFVDMDGAGPIDQDADVVFLVRAVQQGRLVLAFNEATVEIGTPRTTPPRNEPNAIRPAVRGRGFDGKSASCDVVLPFHGHLDFAEAALESILSQESCQGLIHLVDDASAIATHDFLHRWKSHPRIRVYRNTKNIGQFASFNNIASEFVDVDFVAVQDADDISLPTRLQTAVHLLLWTDSDIFGGRVTLFSDEGTEHTPSDRASTYPRRAAVSYFLENPTAVFRTDTFRQLGGFADYGNRMRNRAGLDTEFQMRAYFSGVRFAISRRVVLKYRVHEASATHDSVSGWGTAARTEATLENDRRRRIYQRGSFDPRAFGGLNSHRGITRPV